jgi:lysophospholipase L1-like esterase
LNPETMKALVLFLFFVITSSFMMPEKKYRMLCLGDSYTIGEAVDETERFPVQTAALLKKGGVDVGEPVIIAKTGWTTDELSAAIKAREESNGYAPGNDLIVTLLIGVNNEFRGRDVHEYRKEFNELLKTALHYAGDNANHVFILSIPDWGATPFAANDPKHRNPNQIGAEIDAFNAINKEEALKEKVHYLDITPISRQVHTDPPLLAGDGLHPSGKMYAAWAKALATQILAALQ